MLESRKMQNRDCFFQGNAMFSRHNGTPNGPEYSNLFAAVPKPTCVQGLVPKALSHSVLSLPIPLSPSIFPSSPHVASPRHNPGLCRGSNRTLSTIDTESFLFRRVEHGDPGPSVCFPGPQNHF
jgi:hypothetical protein